MIHGSKTLALGVIGLILVYSMGRSVEVFAPKDAVQQLLWIANTEVPLSERRSLTLRVADNRRVHLEILAFMWRESGRGSSRAIIKAVTERRLVES